MRTQIVSDIHTEHQSDSREFLIKQFDSTDVDVLVLAGDIGSLMSPDKYIKTLQILSAKYPAIILVFGNHEYYGAHLNHIHHQIAKIKATCPKVVVCDQPQRFQIKDQWFIGGTMWFPKDPNNVIYERNMNDFYLIKGPFRTWVYKENDRFKAFLSNHCQPGDIVVTHHLPSEQSIAPYFRTSKLNRFYVSPMGQYIKQLKPAIWFHGHSHSSSDYQLYQTRVICNPHGYPSQSTEWSVNKVVVDI